MSCFGNTSAHAEKAQFGFFCVVHSWKHLRSRGESYGPQHCAHAPKETPPLTRRKPRSGFRVDIRLRNTSAHAEKANKIFTFCSRKKKHLRSRGESTKILYQHSRLYTKYSILQISHFFNNQLISRNFINFFIGIATTPYFKTRSFINLLKY